MYLNLFWAFFVANILGYGGGPATIPLIQREVVGNYHWLTNSEFNEILAMANGLPGPIATKMAGYIGYEQGGILGTAIAVFATIAPSLLLMLGLMGILYKYRNSPQVKRLTIYVKPTIAVLLGSLVFSSFRDAYAKMSIGYLLFLTIGSYLLLERLKVHPALVVFGTLIFGAIFL